MKTVNTIGIVALLSIVAPSPSVAARLGNEYDSYRNLHRETDYGSLFINIGHFRTEDSRRNKDFREIVDDGALELPEQRGYCFVINHYGSPNGAPRDHYYSIRIEKTLRNGQVTNETKRSAYKTTNYVLARKLPDLCISGLWNVVKLRVSFSSTDGDYFDRSIVISRQP